MDYFSCCDTVFGTWRRCPGVVVLIQLGSLFNVGSFVSRDFVGTWPFRFSFVDARAIPHCLCSSEDKLQLVPILCMSWPFALQFVCVTFSFHLWLDPAVQSGFYFDLKVGMSCSDDAFESHLAFAKRAVWGSVSNPIYVVRPPISIPGKDQQLVPRTCGFAAVASPDDEGDTGFEERTESLRIFRAKRTVSRRSWESLC